MQEENRKPRSEIRFIGNILAYEERGVRFLFTPEKKKSLVGMLKTENISTKEIYMERFNLGIRKQKESFLKEVSVKIGLEICVIEEVFDCFLYKLTTPVEGGKESSYIEATEKEKEMAESFLKNPNMVQELLNDFKLMGCVGEETNLLMCYLVATSRLLKNPLSAVITAQAGSGKSMVAELVMKLIPEEHKIDLERITPTVLYYQPEDRMKHKVLSIEEERGAQGADYSLRCLMSKGRVRLALTGRDPQTGEFVAQERECKGPIALLSTTTTQQMDAETRLRMFCLATNETAQHSYNIIVEQWDEDDPELAWREALRGQIERKHHIAQSRLKPVRVYNPYTQLIKRIIKKDVYLRTRRDNKKYRYLMNTIALLRQRQKEHFWLKPLSDTPSREYILVGFEDIELANKLIQEVMPKTLDELSPSARNLLIELCAKVPEEAARAGKEVLEFRFTRRQIREWTKWSDFQIGYYVKELEKLEYVNVLRGGQGAQYEYQLFFTGDPEQDKYVPGLVDVEQLKDLAHQNGNGGSFIEKFTKLLSQRGHNAPQLLEVK